MKHFVVSFLLALLCTSTAWAGDSPDIPYGKLSQYLPALLSDAQTLKTKLEPLCAAEPVSAQALAEADLTGLLDSMRVATKELDGMPSLLLHYRDQLEFYEAEEQAIYRAAMKSSELLEKQLEGLGKLVKKSRSALRKAKTDALAAKACISLGVLVESVEAIDAGVFAPSPTP
ncbi:MAG: hypothetical protein RBU37_10555 [Myxococcota bacterium]|jgi:hypothetical protein|nr:hypothetical protein [Myxococcota bacterium]